VIGATAGCPDRCDSRVSPRRGAGRSGFMQSANRHECLRYSTNEEAQGDYRLTPCARGGVQRTHGAAPLSCAKQDRKGRPHSCSALPDERVSSCVKHCEYDNPHGFDAEEHGVREATSANTADVPVHEREARGIVCNRLDGALYLRSELPPESDAPLFIPQHSIAELALRSAPKEDLAGHRSRRSDTDALTSSQETMSSGFAS